MLRWQDVARSRGLALTATLLAALALLTPFTPTTSPETAVGLLLAATAAMEWLHSFRVTTTGGRAVAWRNAAVTLAMGVLLVNAPLLASGALVLLFALSFVIDGIGHLRAARRGEPRRAASGLVDLATASLAGLLFLGDTARIWTVAVAAALRMLDTGQRMRGAQVARLDDAGDSIVTDLGLLEHPRVLALGDAIEDEARTRAPIDRGWVIAFLLTLLAIHAGRMGTDYTLRGLLGPLAAVAGDVIVALFFAMGLALPVHLLMRRLGRLPERYAWRWWLAAAPVTWAGRRWHAAVYTALAARLRSAVRWRLASYSMPAAFGRGLRIGLPFAAIAAATVPVWGMSWYFDTENWSAGLWNSWAETRTDNWRDAMVRAVVSADRAAGRPPPDFAVAPPGAGAMEPFGFLVIGDPGEGDASQHILRDQILAAAAQPHVRFVVISSDVVYPAGAMRDYEAKFWMPFKGVSKPVYAIPGNHDWYGALEGFNPTFLTAEAARLAMGARVDADLNLSTTTDARVTELIADAARLRRLYGVPTGFQRAPFFQVQTPAFALIAVDTGIAKRVDEQQWAWLTAALARAEGKLTMVILGHPFYAGGHDQREGFEEFQRLHDLLASHRVSVVMAGDTHALEYYRPPAGSAAESDTPMLHVVNGGGGAYLSFGSALAWPETPATQDWAFYPGRADVVAKIEALTPWWKRPAWWWTREFGAWPFSAEWLSAAFDDNRAPFFQSFVEVYVEPAAGRVTLMPRGVHGRLRWSDIAASPGLRPRDTPADAPIAWTVGARAPR